VAQDQTDSLGARLVKLFSPSYDLAGNKKNADEGKQLNTEAGSKYMDAAAPKPMQQKVGKKPAAKGTKKRTGVLANKRTPRKRG